VLFYLGGTEDSVVKLIRCVVLECRPNGGDKDGGFLYFNSKGTCIIEHSTFTSCSATNNAGVICFSGGQNPLLFMVKNSTFKSLWLYYIFFFGCMYEQT
jgi:hypothetical protein